jgi:hypothetical protein
MESPEDLRLPESEPKFRRSSAVSGALRAINDCVENGSAGWQVKSERDSGEFSIVVASDRATRERAYRLAQRVYSSRGYVSNEQAMIVSDRDADSDTITLLAQDDAGRDAATITLVFDSPSALPCDEIYASELNGLRAQGRQLVEVTRLAISEQHQHSKMLLVRLFNYIYVFARRVKGFDDFVIEVNPRHVTYYCRLLSFEVAGPERPCPRVQGAPAVLLRLNFDFAELECRRVCGKGNAARERTLYPYFYTPLEEQVVAELMVQSHRPMSDDDARHFGLVPPSLKSGLLAAAGN